MTQYQVWSTARRTKVQSFETLWAADQYCQILSQAGDVPLLLIPTDRLAWEQSRSHRRTFTG
jgi:hypothetical protein